MGYEFTPVLIPFALATVSVFLPWFVADELSDERYRISLVVSTIALAVWALAELLRISATTVAGELLWHNLRFVGPALSAVGYFIFAAVYTDHKAWVQRQRLWPLFVMPVLTSVLVWTNPDLVRAAVSSTDGGVFVMRFTPGGWYILHAIYSYVLVAAGTWWIVSRFLEFRSNLYVRKQTGSVLLSAGIIMGANLAYNLDVTTLDWTPVGGALWAVIFTVAVSEYRLFDLSPLAREVVVENMESGMVVTNTDSEVIDANNAATTMLETDNGDLIGRQLDDVFFTSMETIEEILVGESSTKTVDVQGDERRCYDVTVSPISIPSDDDIGRVIAFDDVTERVERKQQLEAQKESLERQNEQLDKFASVVSHDLRNPLSTTDGWLNVADDAVSGDDPDLDEAAMALENIEQAHERMETIVDGLLRLARAGRSVEASETVSLGEVAADAWEHATVDDCELESHLSTEIMAEADRDRLLQVFENLFRNAADHNQSGVTLEIGVLDGAESNTDGGDRSGFYIEDDGRGIPEKAREEIFEHGYTTDSDGTGLGLSIVQDVVAAHGWRIDATTGDDGGARFEISGVDIESE